MATTRILYLREGVALSDAMTLLRTEVSVRKIASVLDLSVLIVKDSLDRVALCERLLTDRNAIIRTADPHDPEPTRSRSDQIPSETRIFRIDGIDRGDAITVLRTIYDSRDLALLPEEDAFSVTAPAAKLDNIEALLGVLGVLRAALG